MYTNSSRSYLKMASGTPRRTNGTPWRTGGTPTAEYSSMYDFNLGRIYAGYISWIFFKLIRFQIFQGLHLDRLKGMQRHDIIISFISSDNIKLSELIDA